MRWPRLFLPLLRTFSARRRLLIACDVPATADDVRDWLRREGVEFDAIGHAKNSPALDGS